MDVTVAVLGGDVTVLNRVAILVAVTTFVVVTRFVAVEVVVSRSVVVERNDGEISATDETIKAAMTRTAAIALKPLKRFSADAGSYLDSPASSGR